MGQYRSVLSDLSRPFLISAPINVDKWVNHIFFFLDSLRCKPVLSIKVYFPSISHGTFLSYLCVIFAEEIALSLFEIK